MFLTNRCEHCDLGTLFRKGRMLLCDHCHGTGWRPSLRGMKILAVVRRFFPSREEIARLADNHAAAIESHHKRLATLEEQVIRLTQRGPRAIPHMAPGPEIPS